MVDPAHFGLARRVLSIAEASNRRLSTAESCTGGLLSAALTAIPGSSKAFSGGVIVYSNQAKNKLLGVSVATLEGEGAVSRACVLEMSSGAAHLFGVDVGVAVSGVAGPGGGSREKPVGTVWIAVALGDHAFAFHHVFSGDRAEVRRASVEAALEHLLEKLELA